MTDDLASLPWRTGRRVGRHIYAQAGPEPSGDDMPIGTLDTAELAAAACAAHNAMLSAGGSDVIDGLAAFIAGGSQI